VIGIFVAISLSIAMPWMLSFAAGALMYLIVEELY
jgi:zinc transporter ZupT